MGVTVHINSVLAFLNSREAMRERISEPISIHVSNLVGDSPHVSMENSLHVTKESAGHDGAHSSSGGGREDRNWVRGPPTIPFAVRVFTLLRFRRTWRCRRCRASCTGTLTRIRRAWTRNRLSIFFRFVFGWNRLGTFVFVSVAFAGYTYSRNKRRTRAPRPRRVSTLTEGRKCCQRSASKARGGSS